MKNLTIQRKKLKIFSLFFFFYSFLLGFASSALASEVSVRASIPDTQAPSVPILVAPSDGTLLSDNTPTFEWYESTDNVALSHYVFYLSGSVLYNNIPLADTDNSSYTLDYDELTGVYSLTPKLSLSDASRTWNVVAVDYADLTASSDVWDFRIDTQAPNFVLKKIGDTDVNISAFDAGTVPSSPIKIFQSDATANEPILIAIGEANSSVKLTVTIPGDQTQNYTKNIDGNGNYELQLGIMPRDTDIRLDFIITDQAGHVSVLEKVYFRIELQYWPTATPTSTSTPTLTLTASPSPTISSSISPSSTRRPSSSITPSVTLTVTATPSTTPTPTGLIPIIPPKELIHEASDEIIERLPSTTASLIKELLSSKLWKSLSVVFNLLLALLFYLSSFALLLSKFMESFSLPLFKKISFFFWPFAKAAHKNLVFDYRDTLASPLVKVEFLDENKQVLDFAISNGQGNFNDSPENLGRIWYLGVKDANFYYPIGGEKPKQLDFLQFYQGQPIEQVSYLAQPILIPTLRAAGQMQLPFLERWRIFTLYLLDYPWWFLGSLLLISLIFALRYASWANGLVLAFYLVILLYKLVTLLRKQKKLVLQVEFANQQFSGNLVLSFFEPDRALAQSLIMPFEFAKSTPIKHDFDHVFLATFAKNLTLMKDGAAVGSQALDLKGDNEEIALQINKIQ